MLHETASSLPLLPELRRWPQPAASRTWSQVSGEQGAPASRAAAAGAAADEPAAPADAPADAGLRAELADRLRWRAYARAIRAARDAAAAGARAPLGCDACGVDLRQHEDFLLRPGEFYDLRELVPAVKEGRFEPMAMRAPTDEEITRGREALRQLGPKVFADTDAGSWVLGEGVLR